MTETAIKYGRIQRLYSSLRSEGVAGLKYRVRWRFWKAVFHLGRSLRWTVFPSAYGVKFIEDEGDYTFLTNIIGGHGNFLSRELSEASEPFVFLDIGANHGLYSIIAAQNPSCISVFAFEPVKRTMSFLRANAVLNGVEERISFIEKAVSSESAVREISLITGHSGSGSLRSTTGSSYDKKFLIETIDGHEVERLLSNSDYRIFCKIDVEGHEPIVVDQLLSRLEILERLTMLFVECDEKWFDVSLLKERLSQAGFELRKIGKGDHFDLYAWRTMVRGN